MDERWQNWRGEDNENLKYQKPNWVAIGVLGMDCIYQWIIYQGRKMKTAGKPLHCPRFDWHFLVCPLTLIPNWSEDGWRRLKVAFHAQQRDRKRTINWSISESHRTTFRFYEERLQDDELQLIPPLKPRRVHRLLWTQWRQWWRPNGATEAVNRASVLLLGNRLWRADRRNGSGCIPPSLVQSLKNI